jgi:hypothetical protein
MSAGTFNQPQSGYQQPAYGAQVAGKSGMAVASLAIVFGVLGRKETRGGPKSGEGMATAGLVLGIMAAVLMVPWGIIVAMS